MARFVQQMVIIFILILFLAALPTMISINMEEKSIQWSFSQFPAAVSDFISQLSQGNLGTYQLGLQERSIAQDIGDNFITSLIIMFFGVVIAVFISVIFGIFLSRLRMTKIFRMMMNVLSTIPDFILIVLAMLLAIKIYKWTGIRVISLRPDGGALNIWFPTLLIAVAPTLYMFKLIAEKYYQTSGEDYIRTAVAKGMNVHTINFQHVFKNIEPFIIADLVKVISLAIGNLFIVEYILNVSGITKFIFQSTEIQPIAIGLISMLFISFIVYLSIRLLIYLFKRGFIYE
ncbi:peptide/nickel transport system permease protein [Cytobacillus horneckiae]|uniref:ABC transporter permease n=1 Tax=Cytobacillus horneckiae TaxID=549687 RepID=A0A2N0ZCP2_9BACI|nr:ABC transporter permease subunit [Cytobacillus horneckiae]MBN6888466.1 ABC transporter permease subunit [Cytobacillus horneckiae]MCM3180260.1 ABC transporter permease subunit [Cytobacillus horneckiae]MEC1156493.1 ABC transporter permease subunit [Cytobacillus horneckiae]MED2940784.1 ABC transporter permease subunit [Cytobacillus horneckiae]PKG27280.1 ABC transporter permease [Cytobacillus horneckiae]